MVSKSKNFCFFIGRKRLHENHSINYADMEPVMEPILTTRTNFMWQSLFVTYLLITLFVNFKAQLVTEFFIAKGYIVWIDMLT